MTIAAAIGVGLRWRTIIALAQLAVLCTALYFGLHTGFALAWNALRDRIPAT